jgi:hypothetical protein
LAMIGHGRTPPSDCSRGKKAARRLRAKTFAIRLGARLLVAVGLHARVAVVAKLRMPNRASGWRGGLCSRGHPHARPSATQRRISKSRLQYSPKMSCCGEGSSDICNWVDELPGHTIVCRIQ